MSLWGWFTGSDAARRQAIETSQRNEGFLNQGRQRELGYYGDARNAARNYLAPYAEGGRQGYDAYRNMLGLNGADAQRTAQGAYQGFNPYLTDQMTAATRALDRRAAATGSFNSGLNLLAGARTRADMGTQDLQTYLAHLSGLGNQGIATANALAGNEWQYGTAAGNAERAATQGYVNNNTQTGNAIAAAQVSPLSYMMQNAQMAMQVLGGGGGGRAPRANNNFYTPAQMQSMNGYF